MSLDAALKKRLTPELYQQLRDALGDDFNYDLVPRARLNEVIRQRDILRGGQAQESLPEETPDLAELLTQIFKSPDGIIRAKPKEAKEDVKDPVEELKVQHAAELRETRLRYATLSKLRDLGAKDPEMIYKAGLVDLSNVKGDNFEGLDDALKTLTENKERAWLFGTDVPAGTGKTGHQQDHTTITAEQFKAMPYLDRLKLYEEQPAVYKQLTQSKG